MNHDLKRTLWGAADKLRRSMEAADKHIFFSLIFPRYISGAFDEFRAERALLAEGVSA